MKRYFLDVCKQLYVNIDNQSSIFKDKLDITSSKIVKSPNFFKRLPLYQKAKLWKSRYGIIYPRISTIFLSNFETFGDVVFAEKAK